MKNEQNNFFEQYKPQCKKCNNGKKVVIPANDPENGKPGNKIDILFVNERPGPMAIKTGFISFRNPCGSAPLFNYLFENVFGLEYSKKIFITNAVLWCPKVKKYRNLTPTRSEIECGSGILLDQITKIKPKIIIAMGLHALSALRHCFKNNIVLEQTRGKRLKDIIGIPINEQLLKIIPLFHTAATRNRSRKQQLKDWKKMKKLT